MSSARSSGSKPRGLDRAWLHVDLDVLDEKVMPAVDSPGSPGFDYAQLADLVGRLAASGRIVGADFAIYDPERDPGHAPCPRPRRLHRRRHRPAQHAPRSTA